MPEQAWNPVADLKSRYPNMRMSDEQIYQNLLDPAKFRTAFPQYAKMSDAEIKKGVAKYAKPKSQPTSQAVIDKYKKQESSKVGGAAREGALGFASGIGLPESTHASDFLAVPGLTQMAKHPIDSAKLIGGSIIDAQSEQLGKAKAAIKEGMQSAKEGKLDTNAAYRAVVHGVSGVVPIVGPAAEHFGEEIGTPGMRAHGVGGALGLVTGLGLGSEKGKEVGAKAIDKTVTPVVEGTKQAVGKAARNYAEKTSSKMTGLLPERDTGINVPGRIAEATDKITTLKTAADKYDAKATQATQEVNRLAAEATQKGIALSAPETAVIYKMMDTLFKRSSNLKAMQEFTSLGLDQLKSQLWDASRRPQYINAQQMLELRRDLDELVNYETKSGKDSPVSAAAHKVRTALDQNLDNRVPGWTDANEKSSAMIKTKEALLERKDREFFKTAKATLTDVLKHPIGTLGAGFGAYELAQAAGAPHYVNYVAAIGASSMAHMLYESLPSQTARIMMADGLADMLIGKRPSKGPSSYPPTIGPGRQMGVGAPPAGPTPAPGQPPAAPAGVGPGGPLPMAGNQPQAPGTMTGQQPQSPPSLGTGTIQLSGQVQAKPAIRLGSGSPMQDTVLSGAQGGAPATPAQASQATAEGAATEAFRAAAKKAGMKDAEIEELINKASQPKGQK